MDQNQEQDYIDYEELLETLLVQLRRLPRPVRQRVEKELNELLQFVRDRRPPRFMLMGRRGAGKSTLINAIFGTFVREVGSVSAQTGRAEWLEYRQDSKSLEILDTRGVQEGSALAEQDEASSASKSLQHAIQERCPDIILFLIKAKEVDSAVAGDISALKQLHETIERIHGRQLPVVGILTQCDELDPPDIRQLPTDDEEKKSNIAAAVSLLEKHLNANVRIKKHLVEVVPTVAYVRFRQDGTRDDKRDYRWNIEYLVGLLLDELPKEAKLDFARLAAVKQFQRKVAFRIIDVLAIVCGAIGAGPIPVADLPILTSIQAVMIMVIAYISGRPLSFDTAKEFLNALGINIGIAFGLREGVRALLRLIPGWSNMISGSIAFTATETIGKAAVDHFIDNKSIDEVKDRIRGKQAAGEALPTKTDWLLTIKESVEVLHEGTELVRDITISAKNIAVLAKIIANLFNLAPGKKLIEVEKGQYEFYSRVNVNLGYSDEFITATRANRNATRSEPGHIRYDIYQSKSDATKFILHEIYKSEDAATDHKKTSHYLRWRDKVEPMMATPRSRDISSIPAGYRLIS